MDEFKVILAGGTETVRYDIEQAQEDKVAEYTVGENGELLDGAVELSLGDDIPVEVATDVSKSLEEMKVQIFGFMVPESHLGLFLSTYPRTRIYPMQQSLCTCSKNMQP